MVEKMNANSEQGNFISANGIEIYYQEFGTGYPLVFLHGGMGTSEMARPVTEVLAKHFRVISPDSRGHGRTENSLSDLSYQLMADDIAAFISAKNIDSPFVCGWSDGGQIAIELGIRYTGLAKALVISGAWKEFSEGYLQGLANIGFEAPGQIDLNKIQEIRPESCEKWQMGHSSQGSEYWKDLLSAISELWFTPVVYENEDFNRITDPALILLGDRDTVASVEQMVELYRLIPHSELAIVPNADHSLPRSERYVEIVLDFFIRQSSMQDEH
jgi:pimeloyl-ACP methyl ester carboxylesterase